MTQIVNSERNLLGIIKPFFLGVPAILTHIAAREYLIEWLAEQIASRLTKHIKSSKKKGNLNLVLYIPIVL